MPEVARCKHPSTCSSVLLPDAHFAHFDFSQGFEVKLDLNYIDKGFAVSTRRQARQCHILILRDQSDARNLSLEILAGECAQFDLRILADLYVLDIRFTDQHA